MKTKILIVTSKDDEHTDYIIEKCNSLNFGNDIIRLNTEDFLHNVISSFDGQHFKFEIIDSKKIFFDEDIKTVWYRRPLPVESSNVNDKGVSDFVKSQAEAFLLGLYYCTHESAMWINPLTSNQIAKNKIYQLKLANELGFKVPDVIITNNSQDAIKFSNKHHLVCNKSITAPRYTIGGTEYPYLTRLINKNDIENNSTAIDFCPTFFEEYIEKKLDLRVVIFKNKIFAFEIHSQTDVLSSIDVRGIEPSKIKHKIHNLPNTIEKKIFKFMLKQGLVFSSMDFVQSIDNEYYFIENNCNGQWLWLEYLTDINMSDSFIELLLNHECKI